MQAQLPINRDRAFRPSDFPANPTAYVPTKHFGQQIREEWRQVDGDVIEACITSGDLRDNSDGCGCFRKEWGGGVAYYLIVGWHEKGYRVTVTAWPHLHNRAGAERSGQWTPAELDAIEAKNEAKQEQFADKYPAYAEWLAEHGGY